VRVTNPVLREEDEGLERVSCTARVALDLPPGVQVVGGRRTLSASISYALQPAADGSGDVLTLSGAEGITVPLATLSREGAVPAPTTSDAPAADNGITYRQPDGEDSDVLQPAAPNTSPPPEAPAPVDRTPERVAPPPPVAPPTTAAVSPSFNCARAGNRAERAICGNSGLAALDRQMANRFFAARREANTTQRVLLDRTRGSFLAYRNRCTNDSCIAAAYQGRIREIGDIMADRWVAPN
jgi:hypothetical protein